VEESLHTRNSWHDGQRLEVAREMMHLTLRIVARTFFRTELGPEVTELATAINRIMRLYNYLVALPAVETLIHLRVPGLSGFSAAKRTVDTIVYRMIAQHRQRAGEGDDLLDMMLRSDDSSDESLRDQVITIFLAGYETVANALIWTWYLLSQNPVAEERMFREIESVLEGRAPTLDDVPQLRYTEMVFAESMRLYPPAWAMGRQARADFTLGPYHFPAGTTVLISQFITHRDARHFTTPLQFEPERFAPAGKATFPKFSYFPFGAGYRQCIGESFAWMEGILALATIGQRWRLHLVPGHRVEPQPLITLRPKFGMQMTVETQRARAQRVPA
jgi:cytochrome P450